MERSSGEVVAGKYRLDRVLGQGGMGMVWAATHTITRKSAALKFVRGAPADSDVKKRFLREARAACAVKHPSVVEVYDVIELEDGSPVMVMEHLRGESLAERLAREPRLPLGEVARIMLPVVSAVGTAHALGIVHRDLKPQNIFLVEGFDGRAGVKVLDFGIAKLTSLDGDAAQTAGLTSSGALLGTPCYMSPEQAFGERDIDPRADVWALGVILYQCLSGVLPTDASNIGQVLKIVLTRSIPPLATMAPEVPAEVAALIDRMLSKDRADRPSDLREAMRLLEALAGAPGDARAQDFGLPSVVAPPRPDARAGPETHDGGGTQSASEVAAGTATLPSDTVSDSASDTVSDGLASTPTALVPGTATVDPPGAAGVRTPAARDAIRAQPAGRGRFLAWSVAAVCLAAALAAWSGRRSGAAPTAAPALAQPPSAIVSADPPAVERATLASGAPVASASAHAGTSPPASAPGWQPSAIAPRGRRPARSATTAAPAAPAAPPASAEPSRPKSPIVDKPPF